MPVGLFSLDLELQQIIHADPDVRTPFGMRPVGLGAVLFREAALIPGRTNSVPDGPGGLGFAILEKENRWTAV